MPESSASPGPITQVHVPALAGVELLVRATDDEKAAEASSGTVGPWSWRNPNSAS